MLDMTKKVLKSVSFDKALFRKELSKAKRWLRKEDLLLLKAWCIMNFSSEYIEIVNEYLN